MSGITDRFVKQISFGVQFSSIEQHRRNGKAVFFPKNHRDFSRFFNLTQKIFHFSLYFSECCQYNCASVSGPRKCRSRWTSVMEKNYYELLSAMETQNRRRHRS